MKRAVVMLVILVFSGGANAQLGEFLNRFEQEIKKALPNPDKQPGGGARPKVQQEIAADQARPQENVESKTPVSAEDICSRLQASEELKRFSAIAKQFATKHARRYWHDTEDGLLGKWILTRLNQEKKKDSFAADAYIRAVEKAINECAIKLVDSDLLYLMANDERDFQALQKNIKEYIAKVAPVEVRRLDSSGNLVVESKPGSNEQPVLIGKSGGKFSIMKTTTDQDRSIFKEQSLWVPSWLVALDPSGDLIKKTYPEVVANLEKRMAEFDGYDQRNMEGNRKADQARDAERAAAEKSEQEGRRKWSAFRESFEGRLTLAYQSYQVLQVCNESRRGYAAQLINDAQLSEAKKKIKLIEEKIKSKLKGASTDKLWADAVARNGAFNVTEELGIDGLKLDIIKTIKQNATGNFSAAKSDCNLFDQKLSALFEETVGKESLKKDF